MPFSDKMRFYSCRV
uniref:Uncharacterized protein n=1 Tax=Anguilla anguilla TaxID=7936 RepID=A0A0E9VWD2_ANGAN